MKKQLLKTFAKALVFAFIATITAMEKEPQKPNINFTFVNNSRHTLTIYAAPQHTSSNYENFIIEPGKKIQVSIDNLWKFDQFDNLYHMIIRGRTRSDFIAAKLFLRSNSYQLLVHSEQESLRFPLDPAIPETATITFNPDSTDTFLFPNIKMLKAPLYHTQEPSKLQRPSNIIIKGQEFQIPQELIDIRAPQLKNLTQ
jgi:hypothetical protein